MGSLLKFILKFYLLFLGVNFIYLFNPSFLSKVYAQTSSDWYMAAANPKRTSWVSSEVRGSLNVIWYRPIEAYISPKTQVIAVNNRLYLSTSRGLIVFNADNGDILGRFDTEMPLGNSPTVFENKIYVGGFDKKLHILDALEPNVAKKICDFSGALAGYDANPLVIKDSYTNNQTVVFIGNRDGNFYAIGGYGHPQQCQKIWEFPTKGAIHLSAAYKDGIIYFASNDNYAYALRTNGSLVWKSSKLPGDGFHSFWPVIYRDKLVFSSAFYKSGNIQLVGDGTLSDVRPAQPWSNGYPLINPWPIAEWLEENPSQIANGTSQPFFRPFSVLNISNGSTYTYDTDDADSYPNHIPFDWWTTGSGNRYPPIVDLNDSFLYAHTGITRDANTDPKGKIFGWSVDHPQFLIDINTATNATAEPQAISGGGRLIYRSLCCDRMGGSFPTVSGLTGNTFWDLYAGGVNISLNDKAPGYDSMWFVAPGAIDRHLSWYKGNLSTQDGMYGNHGDQNPIIPHNGKIFIHRSNALLAFGTGTSYGRLPLVTIQPTSDSLIPDQQRLLERLESEIAKLDTNGDGVLETLRPGWLTARLHNYSELSDYFDNPGDTLLTLSMAYPYISNTPANNNLKDRLKNYLNSFYSSYFDPTLYSTIGWRDNLPQRESPDMPSVIQNEVFTHGKQENPFPPPFWPWSYPPQNFYAIYVYAKNIPGVDRLRAYNLVKSKIESTLDEYGYRVANNPFGGEVGWFEREPYQLNAYITGYTGFLLLQELVNMQNQDANLRSRVLSERDRLIQLRYNSRIFTKSSPWLSWGYTYEKAMDLARQFLYLSPELGSFFRRDRLDQVREMLNYYDYITPYWFVSKFEAMFGESIFHPLYPVPALFQARAWILQEPKDKLYKYLDAPAFERGDLFYIQNLVATIEAPYSGPAPTTQPTQTPSPTSRPRPGDANNDGRVDGIDYVIWLNHYEQETTRGNLDGDFNNDGRVDGIDYVIWLNNYSG